MHSVLKIPSRDGLQQHYAINLVDFLHQASVQQAVDAAKDWAVDPCDVCEGDGAPQVDLPQLAVWYMKWAKARSLPIPPLVIAIAAQHKK
jgi:hypothetical protein